MDAVAVEKIECSRSKVIFNIFDGGAIWRSPRWIGDCESSIFRSALLTENG